MQDTLLIGIRAIREIVAEFTDCHLENSNVGEVVLFKELYFLPRIDALGRKVVSNAYWSSDVNMILSKTDEGIVRCMALSNFDGEGIEAPPSILLFGGENHDYDQLVKHLSNKEINGCRIGRTVYISDLKQVQGKVFLDKIIFGSITYTYTRNVIKVPMLISVDLHSLPEA